MKCCLKLETGEERNWEWSGADLPVADAVAIEGTQYVVKQLPLPVGLPWGYHRLTVETSGRSQEALIISAPLKAYSLPRWNRETGAGESFFPFMPCIRGKAGGVAISPTWKS